ncbi:prevent-host-death protein [Desulfovibrio sp. OH1186_COT-070]|nr:prevent-host-death protein [Desulfovibrio sp. OH1209_COT-279]RRD86137.1 prevent-host-death protein [Desulfovibrio sp. OH1186_COT-070]
MSSRAPNDHPIHRAALAGPVFITDRSEPAHVLLTIEGYKKLTGPDRNLSRMLACPEAENSDFEPGKLNASLFKVEALL